MPRGDFNKRSAEPAPTPTGLVVAQVAFAEQTSDVTTVSMAFVDLLTILVTTVAPSILVVHFTHSSSNDTALQMNCFELNIDGVAQRATCEGDFNLASTAPASSSGALVYRKAGLASGPHTIKIRWAVTGGTGQIRPVTAPSNEHASLLVTEYR